MYKPQTSSMASTRVMRESRMVAYPYDKVNMPGMHRNKRDWTESLGLLVFIRGIGIIGIIRFSRMIRVIQVCYGRETQ